MRGRKTGVQPSEVSRIKVALAGVGNVASAFVQGVERIRSGQRDDATEPVVAGFSAAALEFVCAFDVDREKVGQDLAVGIFESPNCAVEIFRPKELGVPIQRGPLLDQMGRKWRSMVSPSSRAASNVELALRESSADVLIILLPTGANRSARSYALSGLHAGCAIINGMPARIASDREIASESVRSHLPVVGDDIKSQVGATILHRMLVRLFDERGAVLDRTLQLDWGGDMDFLNLVTDGRYSRGKRQSKTMAVEAALGRNSSAKVHVSAVDHIPFLRNRKEAYIRVEGRIFGGVGLRGDCHLEVEDGFDSAGIMVDAVRVAMRAKAAGVGGVLEAASALYCKRPPREMPESEAQSSLLAFVHEGAAL